MGRSTTTLIVAAIAFTASGCREGVQPYEPPEREPSTEPTYPLTFGIGNDIDPRFSLSGDTVIYHTTQFGTLPQSRGVMLKLPRGGGVADMLLRDVQAPLERPLATPVLSPNGDRVAYMDLISVDVAVTPCAGTPVQACVVPQPLLDSAVLRVRQFGETRHLTLDPSIGIKFAGTHAELRVGTGGPNYPMTAYPFQQAYADGMMVFRPSWSADGQRIVFSDGLELRIWRVGDASATIVPGTADGVSPAWSPDGQWIAFVVLARGAPSVNSCTCTPGPTNPQFHQRTVYPVASRTIVVLRPDGTDRTALGDGEDPAWSPDGQHLYIVRDDAIMKVARQGGAATKVARTEYGRMPTVSPNGEWLAFARRKPQLILDYDIWVASLVH